jgi:hypothetical protein
VSSIELKSCRDHGALAPFAHAILAGLALERGKKGPGVDSVSDLEQLANAAASVSSTRHRPLRQQKRMTDSIT